MKKDNHLVAGIVDGLRCVGLVRSSSIATRNRIAFLTLDSVLEISFRIFLKHKKSVRLQDPKHRPREELMKIMRKNLAVDDSIWSQLDYCYEDIRCPLYHAASDMTVTDPMLDDYSDTVCYVIREMFGFDAKAAIDAEKARPDESSAEVRSALNPNLLQKVDVIVLSIGMEPKRDSSSILEHLRSLGYTGKLSSSTISAYLSRGKYFFRDPSNGLWKLTELLGRRRFDEIQESEQ